MIIKELYEELEGCMSCGMGDCEIRVCLINTGDEILIKNVSYNDNDTIMYIDIE